MPHGPKPDPRTLQKRQKEVHNNHRLIEPKKPSVRTSNPEPCPRKKQEVISGSFIKKDYAPKSNETALGVIRLERKPSVVVVGAGAIGLSLTGWISSQNDNLYLLARGQSVPEIKMHGLRLRQTCQDKPVSIPVKVIESLEEIATPDIIIITVKNYDLDQAAQTLRRQLGNSQPIIASFQNGTENQRILPKYFSKPTFGIVCYNAWREGAGQASYVKRGYVIIGAADRKLQPEMQKVSDVLNPGLRCLVTDRFQDAVHCKLAINLINALMALVGFRKRDIESEKILVHLTTRLLEEGVKVLQAAGFKEHYLGSLPSWNEIRAAVDIPESPANPLYDFIINRCGPTSMTQDIFSGKTNTELESLNGYMQSLAHRAGVPMPISQSIYEIAKEKFGAEFNPIKETDLWEMINDRILNRSLALRRPKLYEESTRI
jgi:2-dehydropantoate 2-reductase